MTEDELIHELQRLRNRVFKPRVRVVRKQRVAPPATEAQVDRAAGRLGFPLPRLLRRIYLEVGNGGFGPGYGLFGIEDGARRKTGLDVVDGYFAMKEADPKDTAWNWPEKLVPLFDWGGFIASCGDFGEEQTPITEFDPTLRSSKQPMAKALRPQAPSLASFLGRWITGEDVALPRKVFTLEALKMMAALGDMPEDDE
jgi:hypothetical protein